MASLAGVESNGNPCYGRAFGLHLETPFPIDGVIPSDARRSSRRTSLQLISPTALDRSWRAREAEPVLHRRYPDGRPMILVDWHEELGYRVWAPRFGRHRITRDGRTIYSALPRVPPWRWQRLLFAQVLPLAATLQGVELFHASAVAVANRAAMFVGRSGTGKTSIAAHLVSRGATFITDDALALEPSTAGITAHPGAGMVSVDRRELQTMPLEARARLGRVLGASDKVHVEVEASRHPLSVAATYFITRTQRGRDVVITEMKPPDPRQLLANSFVPYGRSWEHSIAHLDLCARMAETVRVFALRVPPSRDAQAVADRVEKHADMVMTEAE